MKKDTSRSLVMPNRSRTYHATGLVLGQTKLGENDLILTVLSTTGEQIRAVAKGGRKPGSKIAGKIRLFSVIEGLFARGKNLDVLTEARLKEHSFSFESDMVLLSFASCIASLTRLVAYPENTDLFLWGSTERVLKALEKVPDNPRKATILLAAHTFKLFSHEGWYPAGLTRTKGSQELFEDLKDSLDKERAKSQIFSAEKGGFVSLGTMSAYSGQQLVSFRFPLLIRYLLGASYDEIESDLFSLDLKKLLLDQDVIDLCHLSHVWAETHLDVRLKSFEYLEKIL